MNGTTPRHSSFSCSIAGCASEITIESPKKPPKSIGST